MLFLKPVSGKDVGSGSEDQGAGVFLIPHFSFLIPHSPFLTFLPPCRRFFITNRDISINYNRKSVIISIVGLQKAPNAGKGVIYEAESDIITEHCRKSCRNNFIITDTRMAAVEIAFEVGKWRSGNS